MSKRNIAAWVLWAWALWYVGLNNPWTIGSLAAGTVWVVWAVGDGVSSVLNTVVPSAAAGVAAPLASAASAWYLANSAMNMAGVDNRVARWLAIAWSAVLWYGAGSVAQPFLIWGAAAKGLWDIGKMAWKSEALKKLGESKRKEA